MSLQRSAGYGSLVALGIGLGDLATLVSLSKRVGNWMTVVSGDEDFLKLLDQDEMDILRRRGLLDIARFNKKWGSQMGLLSNGRPTVFEGDIAEKALQKLSRFTAIMVCVVAALDAFAASDVVKSIIKRVLLELLRTTDYGADILASQFSHRLNSWVSSAILRGLSVEARRIRRGLLQQNLIVDGLMPKDDSELVVTFLVWLLADNSETYTTPSSDIAGIALCLSQLGIDILSVEGFGVPCLPTACRLMYNQEAVVSLDYRRSRVALELLRRVPCTTINLQCPEESLTTFPVDADTANRCRAAWLEGSQAAEYIVCRPVVPPANVTHHDDFKYIFYDSGHRPGRTRTEIYQLASCHAFVANKELCTRLEQVLQHESSPTLTWLLEQTTTAMAPDAEEWDLNQTKTQIWNLDMRDEIKVNAFTVFQAFFMGYFYSIFLKLVDTSTLRVQTVDGAWGYRSPVFLCDIRTVWLSSSQTREPGVQILRRESVLSILSSLLLGKQKEISRIKTASFQQDNWCIGVIEKRALLIRSILKPCRNIRETGSFDLVDVDVSGIPSDINGVVRPGVASVTISAPPRTLEEFEKYYSTQSVWDTPSNRGSEDLGNAADATFHIEADWDGNPETMLLCVRYNGRRIETINPANADITFLKSLQPVTAIEFKEGRQSPKLEKGDIVNWGIPELLNDDPFPLPVHLSDQPNLLQLSLSGRPRLRYYAAEKYMSRSHHVCIVTESMSKAFQRCRDITKGSRFRPLIVITGSEAESSPTVDDWVPEEIAERADRIQKTLAENHRLGGETLKGSDRTFTLGRSKVETYLISSQ
ncbi:hypothetical protein G7Y89_g1256 [Cudoniella acicularis]|uniref:Uncharacterized protein n=1 Tax=Cudoniella acicularis TaxID=354080 RepID=A0A8H4RWR1_9HELO|nr:hypothetical protein G7Y89_g1256 [Cudoniella acicularis]